MPRLIHWSVSSTFYGDDCNQVAYLKSDCEQHDWRNHRFWQATWELKLLLSWKTPKATSTMLSAWQSHSSLRAGAKGMSNAAQSSCRSGRGPKTRENILWKGWVGLCCVLSGQCYIWLNLSISTVKAKKQAPTVCLHYSKTTVYMYCCLFNKKESFCRVLPCAQTTWGP